MFLRRAGCLLVVLVLALFVLRHPTDAAATATGLGHLLAALADAVATFATAL
ncbi:hypothetical protein ABGB12_27885 [Actinocorallia sp. B10E7]|uniref:hypothetical protein n=1 Tax=Actinocorallia sp. B10E7 TaxID=3153558 RepID=UPI00325DF265